jgi:hypothetical protein
VITSRDGKQGEAGDLLAFSELSAPAQYEVRDGRIITTLGTTPLDVMVYKVGDKYVAARSNEFGFANYELQRSE